MDPWIELSCAYTQAGDALALRRRAECFEIRLNGWELMSNRSHHSEEIMAVLACERLAGERLAGEAPRVLVGGLGMGYTLRAALDTLPGSATAIVAELLPEVIAWNRGPLASFAGRPLEDERVTVVCGKILDLTRTTNDRFDAIILDVDNGPDAVMLHGNRPLYEREGLRLLRQALKRSGTLAVWSADRSTRFERNLRSAGFRWRGVDVPARGIPGDPTHHVYLARIDDRIRQSRSHHQAAACLPERPRRDYRTASIVTPGSCAPAREGRR